MDALAYVWNYGILFLIILSVVVFVHEFGHFIVARMCGVKVEDFSIGFGRELFGFTDKKGTRWKFCIIPLGGYVQMFGDADAASATADEAAKEFTEEEKKISFVHQPVHKKMAIIASGPIANYVLAIVALAMMFMIVGKIYIPPVIGTVVENSAAAEAGLEPGDRIVKVDDEKIEVFADLQRIVGVTYNKELKLEIKRDDKIIYKSLTPRRVMHEDDKGNKDERFMIGIVSDPTVEIMSDVMAPHKAIVEAVVETWNINKTVLIFVGQMVTGKRSSESVGGPLRIAEAVGDAASEGQGLTGHILMLVMISINLGLINLFPIPVLDGGHLLMYTIEIVVGRPLNEKTQDYLFKFGLTLIIALMLFATRNDIIHLADRWFS